MFRVCNVSDIKENSLNKFTIEKKEILVGKKNGKLFACDNSCPHRGASLHKGVFKENNFPFRLPTRISFFSIVNLFREFSLMSETLQTLNMIFKNKKGIL